MSTAQQPLAGVAWYDVDDPNSPALDELARRFNLHELQIEDCRHRQQRAKTEEHERYLFSVLKNLKVNDTIAFDDLDVFLGRSFLVTVHAGASPILQRVTKRAQERQQSRLDWLVYAISDQIVDEYLPVLDRTAEEISQIESEVIKRPDPSMLRRIFRLKRKLIEFRRVCAGMREVMNSLMRREQGLLGDDLDPYFRDVYDHLVRTLDLVESYRDLLTGTLDIYLTSVANRTNEVMKALTVVGTLAIPLVVITGFFGMNLGLPWQESKYGALYATAAMAAAAWLAYTYLRRKGLF